MVGCDVRVTLKLSATVVTLKEKHAPPTNVVVNPSQPWRTHSANPTAPTAHGEPTNPEAGTDVVKPHRDYQLKTMFF